jgi:hypothetical protein
MAKVYVRVVETYVHNDEGQEVEGLIATCQHCGRETKAYGRSERSRKFCIMKMSKECRKDNDGQKATNFYEEI